MNSIVGQADRFWLYAIFLLYSTINSGDAVGRYTGIKLSLLSAKDFITFFDL